MDLASDQAEVERLLDALMVQHLATLEKVCAAVGDVADILRFGDDLGTDQGPFMAPATYRKLFKPRAHDPVRRRPHAQQHEDIPALVRLDLQAAARPDRGGL